jgi:hypothetical protein
MRVGSTNCVRQASDSGVVSRPAPTAGVRVALLVCALIGPSLLLVSGSQARQSGRVASLAAAQLVQSAVRDAAARGSVHLVESVRVSASVNGTISGDVAEHAGQQDFRIAGVGDMRVEVVGGIAYVSGSKQGLGKQGLVNISGLSAAVAAKADTHWVSIPPSNRAYAMTAGGVTLSSALSEFTPQGRCKSSRRAPSTDRRCSASAARPGTVPGRKARPHGVCISVQQAPPRAGRLRRQRSRSRDCRSEPVGRARLDRAT